MIQEQDLGQSNVDWVDRTKALAEFGITRPDQKGDQSGHAFHGNRYTGGIGGGGSAAELTMTQWQEATEFAASDMTEDERRDAFYLYDAEENGDVSRFEAGKNFTTEQEMQTYAAELLDKYAPGAGIKMTLGVEDVGGYAGNTDLNREANSFHIEIGSGWMMQQVVCHEVAHAIATEESGVLGHGASFREAYLRVLKGEMPQFAASMLAALAKAPTPSTKTQQKLTFIAGITTPDGQSIGCFGPAKDQKGDTEGHPFHGNRYTGGLSDVEFYHGSPRSGLTHASARIENRQFDNAMSQFGAFVTDDPQEARRYAGNQGHVYRAAVSLDRPYEMPFSEFNKFESPEKDAEGNSVAPEQWAARAEELKAEAVALRAKLEGEGYDGIIVRGSGMRPTEVAAFHDIALTPHKGPGEKGDAEGHPFHGNRYTGGIGGAAEAHEVYASETAARNKLGSGAQFENIDKASEYAAKIYEEYAPAGAAYRADATFGSPIEVRFEGEPYQSGVARVSEGGGVRPYPVITLGEHMHDQLTVIHEVSHIIANEREQGLGPWKENHGGVFKDTFKRILQGEMAAHATLIKSVERVPGKKGEAGGHAFRGNRWTGGIGGDGSRTGPPKLVSAKVKPEPKALRWEDLNASQKEAIAMINHEAYTASKTGWRFGEEKTELPHPLYPDVRAKVIGAIAGLESAGMTREEMVRAIAYSAQRATEGGLQTTDRTLEGIKQGVSPDKIAYSDYKSPIDFAAMAKEVTDTVETQRAQAAIKESQASYLVNADPGKLPEYARESLGRVAVLVQRDGSLFPQRMGWTPEIAAMLDKENGYPADTPKERPPSGWIRAPQAIYDEHLAATNAVGAALYDELQRRLGDRVNQSQDVTAKVVSLEAQFGALGPKVNDAYNQYVDHLTATFAARNGPNPYSKEVNPDLYSAHEAARTSAYAEANRLRAVYDDYADQRKGIMAKINDLKNTTKLEDGKVALQVLGEIRPFGYSEKEMKDNISKYTRASARDAFVEAAAYYPREWYDRAFGKVKMEVGVSNTRPFCSSNLVKTYGSGGESSKSTAVHETGHFMENFGGRSITAAEYTYYQQRVGDTKAISLRTITGNRGYKAAEKSRPDSFADPYMGKDYGNTSKSNYELLTMGMENLRNPANNSPKTDAEYKSFILGVLATL